VVNQKYINIEISHPLSPKNALQTTQFKRHDMNAEFPSGIL